MKTPGGHLAAAYVFCFFVAFILAVTSIPDATHLIVDPNLNWVPFKDIRTNFHQYALNVLLFVPVGFCLPLLWIKYRHCLRTFLFGFLFSLAIEIAQMFSDRITDIDDLLMNTLGTVIGYLFFRLAGKVFKKVSGIAAGKESHWRLEPYACMLFTGLTMFLLQPVFAGLMWDAARLTGLPIPSLMR